MAAKKRLRSLQSVLWDSADSPEELRKEWFGARPSGSDVVATMPASVTSSSGCDHSRDSEEENAKLRVIIQGLKKQVNKLSRNDVVYTYRPPKASTLSTPAKHMDPWYWYQNMDKEVATLPRMVQEIVPSLESTNFCNGKISFNLHLGDAATAASAILHHCHSIINSLFSRHPAIFKIGLTKSPEARWDNPVYGYKNVLYEKWMGMKVIFAAREALPAGLVESSLIQHFLSVPGCRNVNPGGEGVDPRSAGPFFTYVVYRVLVPPRQSNPTC